MINFIMSQIFMKFVAVYMKLYIRDRNLILSTVALFVVKNFFI